MEAGLYKLKAQMLEENEMNGKGAQRIKEAEELYKSEGLGIEGVREGVRDMTFRVVTDPLVPGS